MIEEYAFLVRDKDDYSSFNGYKFSTFSGMFVRSISDTGTVNFNLATTSNPYKDGEVVQNRRATNREITIEFGYDLSIDREEADKKVFYAIKEAIPSQALSTKKLVLRKKKNNVNKYIDCQIVAINQEVFSDEPILQIVLNAQPYWYGEARTLNPVEYTAASGKYIAWFYDADLLPLQEPLVLSPFELNLETLYTTSQNYDFQIVGEIGAISATCAMIGAPASLAKFYYNNQGSAPSYYFTNTNGVTTNLLTTMDASEFMSHGGVFPMCTDYPGVNVFISSEIYSHINDNNFKFQLKYRPLFLR